VNSKALILLTAAFATAISGCSAASDLDLSKFADDPCRLLSTAELNTQDDFKEPKLNETPTGPSCIWDPKDSKRPAYVVTLSTKESLESLKEKAKSGRTFRETTVAGLPAFVSNTGDGKGTCDTTFRASSEEAVEVRITSHFTGNPEYKIACDISEKVAGLVVAKLKG